MSANLPSCSIGWTLSPHLLDPARVRSFAKAERQPAKTGPLDAAVIARSLAALHGELTPYVHDHQAVWLAEHVRLGDLAIAQTGQLRNPLESIADSAMRRLVDTRLARLKAVVLRIERAIATVIAGLARTCRMRDPATHRARRRPGRCSLPVGAYARTRTALQSAGGGARRRSPL